MLEEILSEVNKPGRYIGEEWNITRKDFKKSDIRFALCFPDLYEIGMSNLGVRILYGILNSIADVVCERFFAPGVDLEKNMRSCRIDTFSLESKKGLKEFDIIGFSLGYELNYTNVLNMLELGSIPLEASLRDSSFPLIIGGGPCVMNPEPVADFFDLFVIGEAEEVILEIVDVYRRYKQKFKAREITKQDLLRTLSGIEGIYVPSLYEVRYDWQGKIQEFRPKIKGVPPYVRKRFIRDLNKAYFPLEWLVPYIQIVHDRITLEIMRGCPNRCYFCQARSQYFPFRQRNTSNILDLACKAYKHSGYEEISLAGLSVSDYDRIEELLASLIRSFKEKGVSISLPSLKYKTLVSNLSSLIATIKKTGLTFAPEAGSEKMRRLIGKDFDEAGFFRALEKVYSVGYRHLKLYFMIGLPEEENSDLDGIVDFALRVSELRRKIKNSPAEVNISVNVLIPKPHTSLQWLKMEDLDTLARKQNYLKERLKNKKFIKINLHNLEMSFLEGIFSRGDRRLSKVILLAYRKGARFDAWTDHFNFAFWQQSFQECGIDPLSYLNERAKDEYLPWDFLEVGISKEALLADLNKPIAI